MFLLKCSRRWPVAQAAEHGYVIREDFPFKRDKTMAIYARLPMLRLEAGNDMSVLLNNRPARRCTSG